MGYIIFIFGSQYTSTQTEEYQMPRINLDITDIEYAKECLKEIGIADRVTLLLDINETDWYNEVYTLSGPLEDIEKYINLSYGIGLDGDELAELIKNIEK